MMDLLESFQTERFHLTYGGFYPTELSPWKKLLYYLSCIFNTTISWTQFLLMITFLFHQLSDLTKVSEVLLFSCTQFAFICKLSNFMWHKNNMLQLEEALRIPRFSHLNAEQRTILNNYVKEGRYLAKIYRVLCFGVVLFYGLFPFLDRDSKGNKKLPLPMWFPFNPFNYYNEIHFMSILSIAVGAWTNSNIDILNIMMIILGTAQIEIMKNKFQNVITMPSEGKLDEITIRDDLKECVKHFNDIERFVFLIEDTFSNGILVQFFCSVLVICLTGFEMLVISFQSIQFILLITYFSCMMCQVVMYCWYGHMIMQSSDKISQVCYETDWFECSAKTQKIFITILERSKRPMFLRAGKFFTLNLPTLMAILRSSYSYFAVLQHLYSNHGTH